jgi:phosphoribosylaminoimidazole-succinocarboxamide synthase
MAAALGGSPTTELERISLALYRDAVAHAASRGIIIADTKFEFGLRDGRRSRLTAPDARLIPLLAGR